MVARASHPQSHMTRSSKDSRAAAMSGYYQALMNPKSGPLVGIPTFVPLQTQRQRVRAVGSVGTSTGNITINVNPRLMVANNTSPVRYSPVDGISDGTTVSYIQNNAEHALGDFGDGSDLKARVVALKVSVKNTSSLNDRNGMFYALQERHHHNMAAQTSSTMASDASCIIQSATDGEITLLYRPVQPREVEEWQTSHDGYPDENPAGYNAGDLGPLDQFPGFMQIIWKGAATSQTFFVEVDAIIEYAGETKDLVSSDPSTGAPGCIAAQPRDIPHIVREVETAEQHPAHRRSIVSSIERAALGLGSQVVASVRRQYNPTTRSGRANIGAAGRTVRNTAGYLTAAYRAGGLPAVGVATTYGLGRAAGGVIRRSQYRARRRNYSPYRLRF